MAGDEIRGWIRRVVRDVTRKCLGFWRRLYCDKSRCCGLWRREWNAWSDDCWNILMARARVRTEWRQEAPTKGDSQLAPSAPSAPKFWGPAGFFWSKRVGRARLFSVQTGRVHLSIRFLAQECALSNSLPGPMSHSRCAPPARASRGASPRCRPLRLFASPLGRLRNLCGIFGVAQTICAVTCLRNAFDVN